MNTFKVLGPKGATVRITCTGRHCPLRKWTHRLRTRRAVSVRPLERWLRAGSVIVIRVGRREWIGKYTRIAIRRGRPPTRVDGCLGIDGKHVTRCPK
jgi:hypothetical protein